ncbi:MAG TPA: hypothetical protein VNA69_23650 [Thermoanaerobaculia bacterium]|nr:hypothetical protein [Thermoanaerobaculia bacterium]
MPVDTPAAISFRRPADYYSSATPEPVLPRWAPFGCGAASVLVLIIVFAGGAWLAGGGFTDFMDFVFGMTMSELRGMYDPAVTAEQKKTLEDEIATLRKNLREERVAATSLKPVLRAISKASADEKVHAGELQQIVAAARKLNATAKRR